jgi:hypothetical protein
VFHVVAVPCVAVRALHVRVVPHLAAPQDSPAKPHREVRAIPCLYLARRQGGVEEYVGRGLPDSLLGEGSL